MINLLIGSMVVVACLASLYWLAMLVGSARKHTPSFDVTVKDIDMESVRAAADIMNQWAATIDTRSDGSQLEVALERTLRSKMDELEDAVASEDYERAAELRDDINELNVELKKLIDAKS